MIWLQPQGRNFKLADSIDSQSNISLLFAKYGAAWLANKAPGTSNIDKKREKDEKDYFTETLMKALVAQSLADGRRVFQCLPESSVDRTHYVDALCRRDALVRALGCNTITATTVGRFVTGMGLESPLENGIELHPMFGVPYLPGSAVKGLTRHFAEHWVAPTGDHEITVSRIFGPRPDAGEAGAVIFFDALPDPDVALELDVMTPHYGPWYQLGEMPGDWHKPNPIKFLVVPAGTKFHFALASRQRVRDDALLQQAKTWLQDALDWIGAGAKTAAGYGRFEAPPPTG